MQTSITQSRKNIAVRAIILVLGIGAAIALPQIFHAIGALSGTGKQVGAALLPMHLPVFLAAYLGGPVVGTIAGLLSPLISCGISGMPDAATVPFMMLELAGYGLFYGLFTKTKLNGFLSVLLAQIAGRAVRAIAVLLAIYVLGNTALTLASLVSLVTSGLFGILLQWALLPLLTKQMDALKKFYA